MMAGSIWRSFSKRAHGPELRVLRNIGEQGFEDVSAKLGLDKIKLLDPRSVIAADVDDDNDSDLVVSQLGAASRHPPQ